MLRLVLVTGVKIGDSISEDLCFAGPSTYANQCPAISQENNAYKTHFMWYISLCISDRSVCGH